MAKTAITQMVDILHQNPNEYISKEDTIRLLLVNGKRIEQEQIVEAASEGCYEESSTQIDGEDYYNRTFGGSENLKVSRTDEPMESKTEACINPPVSGSVCQCGRTLDEVDIKFKQCYECGRYWGKLTANVSSV